MFGTAACAVFACKIRRMTDWSLGPNPTMFARDASFRSLMLHVLLHFLIP